MRYRHKSWQDRRPSPTRRVAMFVGEFDVRLKFEDETGNVNRFYPDKDAAQADWDAFIAGTESVSSLRRSYSADPSGDGEADLDDLYEMAS